MAIRKTLGEIYAYGFRNAHRLSWDVDGTMFASDIGMNQIEEINIVSQRGKKLRLDAARGPTGENGRWRGGALNELFPLPENVLNGKEKDGPDLSGCRLRPRRGAGPSPTDSPITARIVALRGKFVFGDIQKRTSLCVRRRRNEERR